MILSPKFEMLHQKLTEELACLPAWKQDALRRDEDYNRQRYPHLAGPPVAPVALEGA